MPKVVLANPTPWPLDNGLMRHYGDTLDVSEDEKRQLEELGLVMSDGLTADNDAATPEPEEGAKPADKGDAPAPGEGKSYPPLPKKSQAPNAWREYARENDIDVRGLSEKSELIGHITKVVNGQ